MLPSQATSTTVSGTIGEPKSQRESCGEISRTSSKQSLTSLRDVIVAEAHQEEDDTSGVTRGVPVFLADHHTQRHSYSMNLDRQWGYKNQFVPQLRSRFVRCLPAKTSEAIAPLLSPPSLNSTHGQVVSRGFASFEEPFKFYNKRKNQRRREKEKRTYEHRMEEGIDRGVQSAVEWDDSWIGWEGPEEGYGECFVKHEEKAQTKRECPLQNLTTSSWPLGAALWKRRM